MLQFLLGGGSSFSAGDPGERIGLDLGFSVLGFGGWADVKGAISVTVLHFLLGGGVPSRLAARWRIGFDQGCRV